MYLIIGASGFIGKHLYANCKRNGIDVIGTYYTHSYDKEWIKFDICSDDLDEICYKHLKEKTLDAVIICGANASIDSCIRDHDASNELNVRGTIRILNKANELGIKSVFLSSEVRWNNFQLPDQDTFQKHHPAISDKPFHAPAFPAPRCPHKALYRFPAQCYSPS